MTFRDIMFPKSLICASMFCLFFLASLSLDSSAQDNKLNLRWEFQETRSDASLRGLCVVNDSVIWASGTGGTVLRTTDGGANWQIVSVPDAEDLDFRDLHAYDENVAVIINSGQPAVFYRTVNGGENWSKVFENKHEKSFFDAIAAINSDHLIAMSDPVDDRILLVESLDRGETWIELDPERRPEKEPGEAGFAASGSNMIVEKDTGNIYLALGSAEEGKEYAGSRVLVSKDEAQTWDSINAPFTRNPSSGIFAITCLPGDLLVAAGGNYLEPDQSEGTLGVGPFGELRNWLSIEAPSGFRSGVTHVRLDRERVLLITVGTNGGDYCISKLLEKENGSIGDWHQFSDENLHAVKSTGEGAVWASGGDGRIAKLLVTEKD